MRAGADHARWLFAAAALAVGVTACSDRAPTVSPAAWAVPDPSRAGVEPMVAAVLAEARMAVVRQPQSSEAWGRYGARLDAHDMLRDAATCYGRAEALAPEEFRWPYMHAIVLESLGADVDEIMRLYERADALQPDFPPTWFRMGEALARQGRLEAARDAYRRAIELDEGLAIAHRGLGQTLLQLDDAQGARRHLERAEALVPGDRATVASLARAYTLLGEEQRALAAAARIDTLREMLSLPDSYRFEVERMAVTRKALLERIDAWSAEGRDEDALQAAEELAGHDPENAAAQLRLGQLRLRRGEADVAIGHLRRATHLDDDLAAAHLALGSVQLDRGELSEARRHLERAVALLPESSIARARLAVTLARSEELTSALRLFEEAARLGALDAQSWYNWATATVMAGDADNAVRRYLEALRERPDYVAAHYQLARLYERVDMADRAVLHYREIARLQPDHPAVARLRELER